MFNLAKMQIELEDWDAAVKTCSKAIEIDPKDAEAWCNLGTALFKDGEGDTKAAIGAFEKALKIDPDDELAWYNIGIAHRISGNNKAAIVAFQKALAIDEENEYVLYNLAAVLLLQGSREKALDHLEKAIEIDDEIAQEAAEDEDFARLRGDPRFEQLTKPDDEGNDE
jgi:tetratricopeptide (TPR) repeat protein